MQLERDAVVPLVLLQALKDLAVGLAVQVLAEVGDVVHLGE